MSTSYPGNLDNLTNPVGADLQNSASVPHSAQHANINDCIEAIEATMGILPQGGFATMRARIEAIEAALAAVGTTVSSGIANASITGAKLVDGTITSAKLANNIITEAQLQNSIISSGKIADLSVTAAKIAAGAISYDKRAASSKGWWKRVANQSIPTVTPTFMSWDVETSDTDGFVSAVPTTTITVPTGKAGLYLIGATISGFLTTAASYIEIQVSTGTSNWRTTIAGTAGTVFAMADIAVNGTVKVSVNNANASSMNATGQLYMVKLFDV